MEKTLYREDSIRVVLKRITRIANVTSMISRDLRKINPGKLTELQAVCLKIFDVSTSLYLSVSELLEEENEKNNRGN